MTSVGRIDDFIAEHRDRLTREAITQQLEMAGYARADIDAAWDRATSAPRGRSEGAGLRSYVWAIYWLGAGLIGAFALYAGVAGGFTGFFPLLVGWFILYVAVAYLPIRALSSARSTNLFSTVAVIVAAPLIVIVVGGGICISSAALIAGSLGY